MYKQNIGFQQDNFSIGYGYDITVFSLSMSSGRSHEISLSYQLPKNSKKRKVSRREHIIPCPKFLFFCQFIGYFV